MTPLYVLSPANSVWFQGIQHSAALVLHNSKTHGCFFFLQQEMQFSNTDNSKIVLRE